MHLYLYLIRVLDDRIDRNEVGASIIELVGLAVTALLVIGLVVVPGMKTVAGDALTKVGKMITDLG